MLNLGQMRIQYLAIGAALALVANALPEYPAQWRLAGDEGRIQSPPQSATVIRQNNSVCDAGSSQWSGTVPLGENRSMFFCARMAETVVVLFTDLKQGTLRVATSQKPHH